MKQYRIIEITSGRLIAERAFGNNGTAQTWLHGLMERGIIRGIAVKLQVETGEGWQTI